jgi:hypothetical protein
MGRGDHGHPKVSSGLNMPDPSMPCRRATPETALWPFRGWPTRRVGCLRMSSTLLDSPRRTPMVGGGYQPSSLLLLLLLLLVCNSVM